MIQRGIRSDDNYLTKKDASRHSGLPIGSLRAMVTDGRIKTVMIGRMELIHIDEVERLRSELEERKRLRVKPEDWNYSGVNF